MKRLNMVDLITYLFYLLLIFTGLWDWFLRNGEKTFRIILILGTIEVFRIIYKNTFMSKYKVIYYCVLSFIFISMYLANIFNFYGIPYYDKILHLISGILISPFGYIFSKELLGIEFKTKRERNFSILFSLIFAIAVAGIWEIWEFSTDLIFNFTAQGGLVDTMLDIICGTIGGIISAIIIFFNTK